MTASAVIYVEEKVNTLVLSGKTILFKPNEALLSKMMAGMKPGGHRTWFAASG